MPIKPESAKRYPKHWKFMVAAVRARAGNRCEGSPAYPDCRAHNGKPHPVTGSKVVLTTAHLEHDDLETQDLDRLRYWCQRCHLTYDAKHHAKNARATRRARKAMADLLDRAP
jgi:hypothetical protein